MHQARTQLIRWIVLVPLFIVWLGQPGVGGSSARQAPSDPLRIIQSAPEFSLANVLGGEVHSRDLKGKVVVVEFWATWAVPAKSAIPDYNQMRKKLKDQGIEFLAVTFESGTASQIAQVVKDLEIEFPVVIATPEVDKAFGGHRGYPTTFVIGRDWKVYRKILGATSDKIQKLEWDVLSLLAMPE